MARYEVETRHTFGGARWKNQDGTDYVKKENAIARAIELLQEGGIGAVRTRVVMKMKVDGRVTRTVIDQYE